MDKAQKSEAEREVMNNIVEDYFSLVNDFNEKKLNGLCSSEEIQKFEEFNKIFVELNADIQQLRACNTHLQDEITKSQTRINLVSKDLEEKQKIASYLKQKNEEQKKKKK